MSLLQSLFFAEELPKVFCNTINTELIKIIKTNKKVKTSNNKNQTTKKHLHTISNLLPSNRMVDLSETDESEAEWQVYKPNKRNITRSPSSQPNKKRSINDNEPSTSNRFDVLSDVMSDEDNNTASDTTSMPKPPPLFIPNVDNISNMIKSFNKIIPTDFAFKALRDNQVKSLKKIVEYCKTKDIKFHTYQVKTERAFRVVIKHLHHSTPVD